MPLQLLAQRSGAICRLRLRSCAFVSAHGDQAEPRATDAGQTRHLSALRQEGVSFVTQALATLMAHDLCQRRISH